MNDDDRLIDTISRLVRLICVEIFFNFQVLAKFKAISIITINCFGEKIGFGVNLSHLVFDGVWRFIQSFGDIRI